MPPSVIPSVVIDQIAAADLTTALAARAQVEAAVKIAAWNAFAQLAPSVSSVSTNDTLDGWLLTLTSGRTLHVPASPELSDLKARNPNFYGIGESALETSVLSSLSVALSVPAAGEHAVAMASVREFLIRLHQHLSVIYPLHEAS
jgi:hypothetical protein